MAIDARQREALLVGIYACGRGRRKRKYLLDGVSKCSNGTYQRMSIKTQSYSELYDCNLKPADGDPRVLVDKIANMYRIKMNGVVQNYTEQSLMGYDIDPDTIFQNPDCYNFLAYNLPKVPTVPDSCKISYWETLTPEEVKVFEEKLLSVRETQL